MESIITAGMDRQRRLLDRLDEPDLQTVRRALSIMIDAASSEASADTTASEASNDTASTGS